MLKNFSLKNVKTEFEKIETRVLGINFEEFINMPFRSRYLCNILKSQEPNS